MLVNRASCRVTWIPGKSRLRQFVRMTEVREEHKPTSVLDNTTRTGRQNDVKAGGVSSAPHLQLPISGGPGLHATLHFAVVTTSASLSSSPGSQPLPTQLTAFRGNQNPQEKWDAWPCPPLKPKQVCPGTWPLPMPPGEGRQHLAPRRGPPRPTVCSRASCVSRLALSRGPSSHPSGPFQSHVCTP